MDSIFGIGLPEFVLILVIAGMVMGPERIVRMARSLGVVTARLQNISRTFLRQLSSELDSVDNTGALRSTAEDLKQLRQQVNDLRNEVLTLTTGENLGQKKMSGGIQRGPSNSIMPPSKTAPPPISHSKTSPENVGTAHRPPSLASRVEAVVHTDGSADMRANRPPLLPRRVDIPEDPDA